MLFWIYSKVFCLVSFDLFKIFEDSLLINMKVIRMVINISVNLVFFFNVLGFIFCVFVYRFG